MPVKPDKDCRFPGCKNTQNAKHGYCEEHKHLKWQRKVRKTKDPDYDSKWSKFAKQYRKNNPLCQKCLYISGKPVKSEVVHHIRPLKIGGAKYRHDNLQALCNDCHEKIHGRLG